MKDWFDMRIERDHWGFELKPGLGLGLEAKLKAAGLKARPLGAAARFICAPGCPGWPAGAPAGLKSIGTPGITGKVPMGGRVKVWAPVGRAGLKARLVLSIGVVVVAGIAPGVAAPRRAEKGSEVEAAGEA